MKEIIRQLFRSVGWDVTRYDPKYHPVARQKHLFAALSPTVVLDVGANEGEFSRELRKQGYQGKLISFEPRESAFRILKENSDGDVNWTAYKLAVGSAKGSSEIRISGNVASSSLLPMADLHVQALPGSETRSVETIEIVSLDELWPELGIGSSDRVLLKLDVQGFESEALDGAKTSLSRIQAIHMELSLQSLYEGGPLIEDLIARLRKEGFRPVAFSEVFSDESTCHLLQLDGLFLRS